MRRSEGGKKDTQLTHPIIHTEAVPNINLSYYLRCHWWLYWLLLQELWNNQKGICREGRCQSCQLYCNLQYYIYSSLLYCPVFSLSCFVLHFVVVCSSRSRPWAEWEGGLGFLSLALPAFLPSAILIFFLTEPLP